MQTFYLQAEDDIISICDRLEWSSSEERVLLVFPEESSPLPDWLDLVRLRRCAERLRLEVGLVTLDGDVRARARALGLPSFRSVGAAERGRRGWWRGRRSRHKPTRPGALVQLGPERVTSVPNDAERRELERRRRLRPTWERWARRYLGILLFFMTVGLLVTGAAYAIPGATLTLQPEVEWLEVSKQVVADPELETVNYSGASIPARRLDVDVTWQAEVATTGTADVPDAPGLGTVLFVNLVEQPVTVPAGTRVSTSAGERIVFQTIAPVDVPGVVGGTAETEVIALEPGPSGNVEANLINRIEGSLALQLEVRNLEATSGGGVRTVPAVSEKDQERLRAQVLQQLQTLATAEMEAALASDEFLARDSLQIVGVEQETYSHFVGEQSERLALEVRASIRGTAVDSRQANDIVYDELAASVQPSYELIPESLKFSSGDVLGVDGQGRVTFMMRGEGMVAAKLQTDELLTTIAGQDTGVATAFLYEQLPLQRYPSVEVWPDWLDRMPFLPERIRTVVTTSTGS